MDDDDDNNVVVVIIIVRYTLLLAHAGLRCMRHADVDAQYDTLHIDSNEILLRHAVDGRTSDCIV